MKTPKPFTAVHAIGFIYNAFAHVTDGEQVAEEISAVVESLADFNCSKEQIAEIYDWYCDVFAEGEEEMQKTLNACLSIVERTFKENDPQKIVAKGFIDNLVDIAKADGVIKDSEKAWLTNFCKILDIEEPNILKENNEPDISTDDITKGLEQSQRSDRPQIIMAIANQKASTEDIQEIIKADPNQVHATDTREDAKGYSALHYACWDGRTDIAKFLIEQGADIHLKGLNDGCTPLLLCGISPNCFECAKLLIELGAELENRNMESNMYHSNGATILRLAVINCCYDLADLLIEKGASLAVLTEPCTKEAEDTDFFIACRNICPEYYPQLYDSERLETICNIAKENNIGTDSKEEVDNDESNAEYMALSHKTRSEEENKFLSKFILKWMAKTERFANVISKIQFPGFLQDIDNLCPVFSDEEIAFINHHIRYEKCIPSLKYAHDPTFYNHTKQVWWLAPCVYWGDKLVSWVMVDKNGFYAPHPDEWDDQDNVSAIFSWEKVEDVSFDIDDDESGNKIAILNLESTDGGELTFYELLEADDEKTKMEGNTICRGSYLSVFKNIFDVNHANILESRGTHTWNHGVGSEGFQGFAKPKDLLNQAHWKAARKDRSNFKTHELFDYIPEEENENISDNNVDTERTNADSQTLVSTDTFSFDDYISTYKENHPNEKQDENLLRATVDFVFETVEGTDGLLEVFSRTGGYSVNANNKLKNGKFAQVRWSKSDRKESKPVRYFVDLYLLKSKMDYKIDTLANQSLQSPHAHEFYMIRLYSQDDLDNFRQYQSLIMDSLKARQKNKLITKRKNLSKKQLKEEFLRDLGVS